MARLQILELPEGSADDRPPFVLVVDQYEPPPYPADVNDPGPFDGVAEKIGARAVLVFEETINIPANDTSAYLSGGSRDSEESTPGTVRLHVEGDFEKYREQVREEIQYAMGKTTRALAGEALGAERTDIARDWDDIRNAVTGLRQQRDAQAEALERVRNLHRPVEHGGVTICAECSGWDGSTTDNSPCGYEHCPTLRALDSQPAPDA